MNSSGYTFAELIVVIAVAAVLSMIMAANYREAHRTMSVTVDARTADQAVRAAIRQARQRNSDQTLTISETTLTVTGADGRRRSYRLSTAPLITCNGPCPAGNAFTFKAPFGTSSTDFQMSFRNGAARRAVLFRGPLALGSVL